jgi:hypothetical protein
VRGVRPITPPAGALPETALAVLPGQSRRSHGYVESVIAALVALILGALVVGTAANHQTFAKIVAPGLRRKAEWRGRPEFRSFDVSDWGEFKDLRRAALALGALFVLVGCVSVVVVVTP